MEYKKKRKKGTEEGEIFLENKKKWEWIFFLFKKELIFNASTVKN